MSKLGEVRSFVEQASAREPSCEQATRPGGTEHRRVAAYAERYLRKRVEAAETAARQGKQELFETLYLRGETLDGPRPEGTAHARSPWKG